MGIQATLELSKSENAKIVIVGGGKDGGLPIIGNMPLGSFTEKISAAGDPSPQVDNRTTEDSAVKTEAAVEQLQTQLPEN